MATKARTSKQAPATAQAPVASVVAAMATTLAAQQPAPVPATVVAVPASYAGIPYEQLTPSQQALARAKHAPAMPKVPGALTVVGAKLYRVRTATNSTWWQAILEAGASKVEGATPAALQAAVTGGKLSPVFLQYAIVRGWLVPA